MLHNEFLGVTICSTTLSAMCYLYNTVFKFTRIPPLKHLLKKNLS